VVAIYGNCDAQLGFLLKWGDAAVTDEDRKAFEFWRETYRASELQEAVFRELVQLGSVESVELEMQPDGRNVVVSYRLASGARGLLFTRRGKVKTYRLDTALRFLRGCGVVLLTLTLNLWRPPVDDRADE
jgi:hypothetical protein